ncbi:hypothetical protein [Nocardiopsis dassonvillei]|uniref:hypothetical protein n=1 Tax=Nocardiopsis dassonvillei TaxID=2014 RepID=UPI0012FDD602|nr:hypothetical protein [Nocardiopsis dassonvillei]
MSEMWYGIALFVFLSVFLALLAWLNHRHFDKFFDAMDGRFEGLVGGRSRREGAAYRFQRNLATAVLALFSASFLWYALKAIYLAVFGS